MEQSSVVRGTWNKYARTKPTGEHFFIFVVNGRASLIQIYPEFVIFFSATWSRIHFGHSLQVAKENDCHNYPRRWKLGWKEYAVRRLLQFFNAKIPRRVHVKNAEVETPRYYTVLGTFTVKNPISHSPLRCTVQQHVTTVSVTVPRVYRTETKNSAWPQVWDGWIHQSSDREFELNPCLYVCVP